MTLTAFFKKAAAQLKKRSIANWGFPFILAFILLLSTSAILVAANSASIADTTAMLAYFSLLIGVILEILCYSKAQKAAKRFFERAKSLISKIKQRTPNHRDK